MKRPEEELEAQDVEPGESLVLSQEQTNVSGSVVAGRVPSGRK